MSRAVGQEAVALVVLVFFSHRPAMSNTLEELRRVIIHERDIQKLSVNRKTYPVTSAVHPAVQWQDYPAAVCLDVEALPVESAKAS